MTNSQPSNESDSDTQSVESTKDKADRAQKSAIDVLTRSSQPRPVFTRKRKLATPIDDDDEAVYSDATGFDKRLYQSKLEKARLDYKNETTKRQKLTAQIDNARARITKLHESLYMAEKRVEVAKLIVNDYQKRFDKVSTPPHEPSDAEGEDEVLLVSVQPINSPLPQVDLHDNPLSQDVITRNVDKGPMDDQEQDADTEL